MNTTVNQNTKPAINQTEENVSIKSLNEQKALLVTKISDNPTQEDFNNLTKINVSQPLI